ncbi:MAG: Ig-like domain-containing protein [Bacteroidales bacterium]|nr:Ig-like domain-containing protein [Bacteroidales bacterium]
MKKLTLFLATILCACLAIAQVPQTMNFQALIRDASGLLVTYRYVDIELNVLDASQAVVYSENHTVYTDFNAVVTLEVGAGTVNKGSFSDIDWASGKYYLETKIQLPDGSVITDASPLLSVPYSLYAAKAGEVDIDLSEYAKKSDIPEAVDLSDYALKSEIPSEVSLEEYAKKSEIPAMPDLSGYALKSEIPAAVDLTDYAKKSDIPEAVDLSGYALKSEIPAEVDLTDYALKSELPIVPDVTGYATKTEVSENYLTKETFENYVLGAGQPESVDLSVYAKTADVNAALATLESQIPDDVDLTDYAKSADIESAYAKKSDLDGYALVSQLPEEVDLTDYAKSADIESAYAKKTDLDGYALVSQIPAEVDLTDYALKSELPTVPDVTAFATKTEVSENYLTKETFENYVLGAGQPESVDLSVYAKTADVNAALATLEAQIPNEVDLTDYAKSADIESAYAKKTDLNNYALVSQIPDEVDLTDYAKTEAIPTKLSDLNNDVAFVKEGNNVSLFVNDVEYVKKSYVDSLFTIVFQKCDSLKTALSNSILLVTSIELQEGSTMKLEEEATYTMQEPIISEATNRSFTWSIEGEGATITEDGVVTVTGDAGGTFTIVATANDGSGVKGECTVTIIKVIPITSLSFKQDATYEIFASEQIDLGELLVIEPADATYTNITWSILATEFYGSIDENGVFTPNAELINTSRIQRTHNIYVVVTANDDTKKSTSKIIVINPDPILVTSITVPESINIEKGGWYYFNQNEVSVLPSDANDKTYTWSIKTENAPATITNDGYITLNESAQDGATFVVVATANDGSGVTGECTITVVGNSSNNEGALSATFSVSASKQVYFSQGNLQYQASTNTWRFAENQYDIVGADNANISSSNTGWIDLFCWGTSGYDDKFPWMTSQTYTDYETNNISGTNYDWGVYNSISNGGNESGLWRTLTKAEWVYLLESRPNASNKVGHAEVNGVNGIVLLPDEWNLPDGLTFTGGNGASTQNTYTAEQWTVMERRGAVFLPAAGVNMGSAASGVNSNGYYWASTYYGEHYGYTIWFADWILKSDYNYPVYYGESVRLVQDAE